MPESQNLSFSLSNLTGLNQPLATEPSNVSILSALLSLKGWSDLNPPLQALDEAEHNQQLGLKNTLALYEEEPTQDHGERLMHVLLQEQAKLVSQKEEAQRIHKTYQAQAELTTQQTTSTSFSNLWQWVSHGVQDFFGSSPEALAEHYKGIAKQREQQLNQLNSGIALLQQELESFESSVLEEVEPILLNTSTSNKLLTNEPQTDEIIELERSQQEDTIEPTASSTSKHLLQQNSGLRLVGQVPNQVIPIGKPYSYSMNDVFTSDNSFVLGVTQTGQSALPSWLSFESMLLNTYPANSGEALGVTVSDNLVFLACGYAGLQVFDASNPKNITLLSLTPLPSPGLTSEIAVSGSTIFVINDIGGLQVFDVSNPNNLSLLSTYTANAIGGAQGITVFDSIVFLACGYGGLHVLNASNPKNLSLLSTYIYPPPSSYPYSFSSDVAVFDSTVFLVNPLYGVQVLDASNLSNLRLLNVYYKRFIGEIRDIEISDSTVFLAGELGLTIWDAGDGKSLRLLNTYQAGFNALGVTISASLAFLARGGAGLQVLDVSNLHNLRLLSTYPTTSLTYDAAISNSVVFVADGPAGLQILDISQGLLTGISPSNSFSGEQLSLTVSGEDLMTNELLSFSFTLTLDSFPTLPQTSISDQSIFPDQTLSLLIGTNLFSSSAPFGLSLSLQKQDGEMKPDWIRLTPEVQFLNSYSVSGHAVIISESMAFIASHTALQVLDISNPKNFSLLGTYSFSTTWTQGIAVSGSTVFVANLDAGLQILDVSNPRNITLLSNYKTNSTWAYDVTVSNSAVFVTCGNMIDAGVRGLQILDASNPLNLSLLSTYSTSFTPLMVLVSDSTVFIKQDFFLQLVDATNLRNLSLLSTYYLTVQAQSQYLAVSGSIIFITYGTEGLQVLDASNPKNLSLLSTYHLFGDSYSSVTVFGSIIFLKNHAEDMQILDASNPRKLSLLSRYREVGRAVALFGSTVFVTNGNSLQALDISQQTVTGTPNQVDVGNYKLKLVATDMYGGSIAAPFTVRVEGAPQIHDRISLQYASMGQVFTYFIPQDLITDPNNDPISFSARLAGFTQLPNWLRFNPIAAVFMGTPEIGDEGTFNISLSSTDNIAGFTNTSFILFVGTPIPVSAPLYQGRFFNFSLPMSVFNITGVILTNYAAFQTGRLALPDWLRFNPDTLVFEGTPPLDERLAYVMNLKIVASNDLGDSLETGMSFQVVPNMPFQVSPPSIQTATTNTEFRFIANHIFNQPNGFPLVYSASEADGSDLPSWLFFNATEPPMFFGMPGYGDTDFYAARLLQIRLNASDGIVSGTSLLTISVGGMSWGQLAILVASPILSILTAIYSAYMLRAVVLNRVWKRRYQKKELEREVDGDFYLQLTTPAKDIDEVTIRQPAKEACVRCCQFFKLPAPLSGGAAFPYWLEYDSDTREIRSKRAIPESSAGKTFFIQVCNEDGVILEEYVLKIRNPRLLLTDEKSASGADELKARQFMPRFNTNLRSRSIAYAQDTRPLNIPTSFEAAAYYSDWIPGTHSLPEEESDSATTTQDIELNTLSRPSIPVDLPQRQPRRDNQSSSHYRSLLPFFAQNLGRMLMLTPSTGSEMTTYYDSLTSDRSADELDM